MTQTTLTTPNRSWMLLLAIIVVAALAWAAMNMRDDRSAGERMGDAIEALPQGIDKAGNQLRDRTPAERVGDAVEDAGDNFRK